MAECVATIFDHIYRHEKKSRKSRYHDETMAELRGQSDHNSFALEILDAYRGESSFLFPLLAGTLLGGVAQDWASVAFSVGPYSPQNWDEWGMGTVFASWREFCKTKAWGRESDRTNLSFDLESLKGWNACRDESHGNVEHVIQVGQLAGGDGLWVLPNGEVWMQSAECDEIPFLPIFDDISKTAAKVAHALENGDLVFGDDEIWRWGERWYDEGDYVWVAK